MKKSLRLAALSMALLIASFAAARAMQSASQDQKQDAKSSAAQMAAPQPGPEMEKLRFLLGSWDWDAEYLKSPMMPNGQKQKGWYKAQLGPGGFSLIADFDADSGDHHEIGHEVISWDPAKNNYTTVTVGNGFPGAVVGAAHWEGDKLVTEYAFGDAHLRSVYSNIQPNSTHMEDYYLAAGAPPMLIWKGEATRK